MPFSIWGNDGGVEASTINTWIMAIKSSYMLRSDISLWSPLYYAVLLSPAHYFRVLRLYSAE